MHRAGLIVIIALFAGGVLGYCIRAILSLIRKNSLERAISERLIHAREHAQHIIDTAKKNADALQSELRAREKTKELGYLHTEERLANRETLLAIRESELDERLHSIEQKQLATDALLEQASHLAQERLTLLEETSTLSREEAKQLLFEEIENNHQEDFMVRSMKLETQGQELLAARARDILATSIQRLAVAATNELTTATVTLPNEEVKGKIIGKEGRNIRAFERLAGVELLIDETPNAIIVSCHDPVRRAIATHALEALIADGRIQPAKIEEEFEKARVAIHDVIKEKGVAAVYECGIYNFDPRLVAILGRLHFRTSYGQNVLAHSIEMAHIAAMIAAEIGADTYIAKAGALVHDIGKALDHEFEGSHVEIGIKVMRRFDTDERIITSMKSHHDDCPHESVEAVIVQTADMISGARPGARRDTAELYIKRLADLEGLAEKFAGVERAYALQAGREIRVFVQPDEVSDFAAKELARAIATTIETELRYPGQIKVTIIREMRITNYAR